MKTVIDLNLLSLEAQKEIISLLQNKETSIKELKEKIKTLKNKYISYRTDINLIESGIKTDLTFDLWEKTAGEQWGNCSGRNFKLKIGTKYLRFEVERYRTNLASTYFNLDVSVKQVIEIVDMLLLAEGEENEVDQDKFYQFACDKLETILEKEFAY